MADTLPNAERRSPVVYKKASFNIFNTCKSPWACDYITVTVKGKVKDMPGVKHL